jgi:hypothetical protein
MHIKDLKSLDTGLDAVGGKTGKTLVLPRFSKIEGGVGSGGGAPQWCSYLARACAPRRRRRCDANSPDVGPDDAGPNDASLDAAGPDASLDAVFLNFIPFFMQIHKTVFETKIEERCNIEFEKVCWNSFKQQPTSETVHFCTTTPERLCNLEAGAPLDIGVITRLPPGKAMK